jgi:isopentenyldiphosphate isomerase
MDESSNQNFRIFNIQIMLDLNGKDKPPVPFTLDMLYHPELEEEKPLTDSKIPYFTRDVMYSSYMLEMPWKDRVEFFFNSDKFNRMLQDEGSNWFVPDLDNTKLESGPKIIFLSDIEIQNEKANVMTMLRALFPISPKFDKVISSSYDNYVLEHGNIDIIQGVDVMESLNFFGFMDKFGILKPERERKMSYIKIGGKPKVIYNVVWENDVVNHPVYSKFIETYHVQTAKNKVNIYTVQNDFDYNEQIFNDFLKDLVEISHIKKALIDNIYEKKEFVNENGNPMSKEEIEEYVYSTAKDKIIAKLKKKKSQSGGIPTKEEEAAAKKIQTLNRKRKSVAMHSFVDVVNELINTKRKDKLKKYKIQYDIKAPEDTVINILKTPYSIDSFSSYLNRMSKESRDNSYKESINRIIQKIQSLNSLNGINASETVILIQNNIDEFNESSSSSSSRYVSRIGISDFKEMFSKLLNLATILMASNKALKFIKDNVAIELPKDGKYLDGRKETKTDSTVNRKIRELHGNILKLSEAYTNSLMNVYKPKRMSSNKLLIALIEKLKMGKLPEPMQAAFEPGFKVNTQVFTDVYTKYYAYRPPKVRFADIKEYMYTGVDSVIKQGQSDDKNDDKVLPISEEMFEIYVEIDLLDKTKFEKEPKAKCRVNDDSLKNELHNLLDSRTIFTVNPYREFSLAKDYVEYAKGKNTEIPETGGRSRRFRRRPAKNTRRR